MMGRALAKWALPPLGVIMGWAAGATAGAPAPAAWTVQAVIAWAWVPFNWAFALVGLGAGVGTYFSVRDRFWPDTAILNDIRDVGALTRAEVGRVIDQVAEAGAVAGDRHSDLIAAIKAQKVGFTPEDIRAGRVSEADRNAFVAALGLAVERGTETTAALAGSFAKTVGDLALSRDRDDRDIAAAAVEGNPLDAADRLMEEVGKDRFAAAERARQAGSLYAPFNIRKAIAAYTQAVELDAADPWTWGELADLHLSAGDLASARRCAQQARQYAMDEAAQSAAECRLGDAALEMRDFDTARSHFRAYHGILDRMATAYPEDPYWRGTLPLGFDRLARLADAEGDVEEAISNFEKSLELAQAVALETSSVREWRGVLISHNMLGDLMVLPEQAEERHRHYLEARAITERLSKADPSSTVLQRDLVVSYEKLGDFARSTGTFEEAESNYSISRAVAEKLAGSDENNASWQRTLAISFYKHGLALEQLGDRTGAIADLDRAGEILDRLIANTPGHPGYDENREAFRIARARVADGSSSS